MQPREELAPPNPSNQDQYVRVSWSTVTHPRRPPAVTWGAHPQRGCLLSTLGCQLLLGCLKFPWKERIMQLNVWITDAGPGPATNRKAQGSYGETI